MIGGTSVMKCLIHDSGYKSQISFLKRPVDRPENAKRKAIKMKTVMKSFKSS